MIALIGVEVPPVLSASDEISVAVASGREEMVSGDNVLVRVHVPVGASWNATLNDSDVTQALRAEAGSGYGLALLDGLRRGRNTLKVTTPGVKATRIEIDHALTGPVFSGHQQYPFICQTQINGLGAPLDKDCSARAVVKYYYQSTDPIDTDLLALEAPTGTLGAGFKPYDVSNPPPSDVAQTVTQDGRTVPYIVRREIGTINRAIYDIQFLHQPGQPLPTPWKHPINGWNGDLVYQVNGGCGAGYRQGELAHEIGVANQPFIEEGFATATATLSTAAVDCNERIVAETVAMVKDHFIKQYGVPRHTIGWGSSGGAFNQLLMAQNYPGLLDGLVHLLRIVMAEGSSATALAGAAYIEETLHWLPDPDVPADRDSEAFQKGSSQARPRILWADDNADMRRYVADLLGRFYEVLAVPDGEAALEAALAAPPDLVLSDVMMPRLDGFG